MLDVVSVSEYATDACIPSDTGYLRQRRFRNGILVRSRFGCA
jgi:hypothetical protein